MEIVRYHLIVDSCYRRFKKGIHVTLEEMIDNKGRCVVIEHET